MYGESFDCHKLDSATDIIGYKPGMLIIVLQCTGESTEQNLTQFKMSVVLPLADPELSLRRGPE